MIYSKPPRNWKALQSMVACVLKEAGMTVEIEKKLQTARGVVSVDVYAEDIKTPPALKIMVECKNWKTRVPQEKVHAFQMQCQNYGADVGYFISSKGFQRGAKAAAEYSNIRELTWDEFQAQFYDRWFANRLAEIGETTHDIFCALDPLDTASPSTAGAPEPNFEMSPAQVKYLAYSSVNKYSVKIGMIPNFPMEILDPRGPISDLKKVQIKTAKELFDILEEAKPFAEKMLGLK